MSGITWSAGGIVEPVDDFRDSNPASNDELLNGLIGPVRQVGLRPRGADPLDPHEPDLRPGAARTNELNVNDSLYFAHAATKLLPAEVLLDAISTVTAQLDGLRGLR